MKKIIGIDYSLNSPALCISETNEIGISIKDCTFHFLTAKKKYQGEVASGVYGYEYPKYYSDNIQRFDLISEWVLSFIKSDTMVFIEGYSFGSKGQGLFQIAENCGILKHKLMLNKKSNYSTIVPSVVKKRATTKGNANKELMYEQFMKDGGEDLVSQLGMNKLSNPVTDIVDSYYIMRTGNEDWYCN